MKKQHRTYLLLVLVIGIWGVVGFRLVKAINPSNELENTAMDVQKFVPTEIKERKKFDIVANYRDPFLGTFETPKPKPKVKAIKREVEQKPKKNISYTGFISGADAKNSIFFVTIDGTQHMMEINGTVQEVKLLQGSKDYIRVRHNGITEKVLLSQ